MESQISIWGETETRPWFIMLAVIGRSRNKTLDPSNRVPDGFFPPCLALPQVCFWANCAVNSEDQTDRYLRP